MDLKPEMVMKPSVTPSSHRRPCNTHNQISKKYLFFLKSFFFFLN